ncbi:ABC-F family ATP-binding cassette domain-containing protein [Aerococcaceae bacterium zg-ZJ1578]|uniref:ribosomal protection-like ABC-F family protein n=1 Tax=Aerococcaceae bacterium zg-252 TaxID=2796928 RepID=UPI001A1A81D7|nr:ABC-F family ATP-binding cassette domain-containing protein [Aerococcaceae bacterium zg-1578]
MDSVLIHIKNYDLYKGGQLLYNISDLIVKRGERVGIIGDNGSGKTSLLELISQNINAGNIKINSSFNYFKQFETSEIEHNSEYDYKFLSKVNVPSLERKFLSGGENQKLRLSQLISENSETLILDEPFNYLDNKSITVIIDELCKYNNTVIFVTHNRDILNQLATKIWAIEDGKIFEYLGNYDDYLTQRKILKLTEMNKVENFEKQKKHLEKAIDNKRNEIKKISSIKESKKKNNINPGRLASSKDKKTGQKGIEKSIKNLEKRIENLGQVQSMEEKKEIVFPQEKFYKLHTKIPIVSSNHFELFAGEKLLINKASFQFSNNEKIAIIGDNGVGKSTFLENIFKQKKDIFVSSKAKISFLNQITNSNINRAEISAIEFIRKNSEYPESFITEVLLSLGISQNSLNIPLHFLSGGEYTKLLLAKTFLVPSNIIILDEPTNFLDINTIEALEKVISSYPGMVIASSHDSKFVDTIADSIYQIRDLSLVRIL